MFEGERENSAWDEVDRRGVFNPRGLLEGTALNPLGVSSKSSIREGISTYEVLPIHTCYGVTHTTEYLNLGFSSSRVALYLADTAFTITSNPPNKAPSRPSPQHQSFLTISSSIRSPKLITITTLATRPRDTALANRKLNQHTLSNLTHNYDHKPGKHHDFRRSQETHHVQSLDQRASSSPQLSLR